MIPRASGLRHTLCRVRSLRKPILVNDYEKAVDAHLLPLTTNGGLRLHCKPRLADVLPVDGQVSGADLSFALKAHFDFVLADQNGLAELAVEFDGPAHHRDPVQLVRDERKDRICRSFALPLLRVGAPALRPADERSLLQWVLEVWRTHRVLRREWDEIADAEERGEDWDGDLPEIRLDDFDYKTFSALRDEDEPGRTICAPLDAFLPARQRVGQAWLRHGWARFEGWRAESDRCSVGQLAIEVGDDAWLLATGRANLRGLYPWIDGLCPPIVAQDIAMLDLDRQIAQWEVGCCRPVGTDRLAAAIAGARPGLLSTFERPSKWDTGRYLIETMKQWGLDSPIAEARVWTSVLSDPGDPPFALDDDW